MKKIKLLFCGSALIMSIILGFVSPFRSFNLNIVSENVEALTKSYETKKINGVNCSATELGRKPDKDEVNQLPENQLIPKVIFSTTNNEDQIFYAIASDTQETLHKCDLDDYGYGFENGQYCWLPSSEIDKKKLNGAIYAKNFK